MIRITNDEVEDHVETLAVSGISLSPGTKTEELSDGSRQVPCEPDEYRTEDGIACVYDFRRMELLIPENEGEMFQALDKVAWFPSGWELEFYGWYRIPENVLNDVTS